MTATSALSASNANSFQNSANDARTVLVPGSPATYANRAVLREMGLRWDPTNHRWHGTTTVDAVKTLRERLGLVVRCSGDFEAPLKCPAAPKPALPGPAPIVVPTRDSLPRPHDGSRTRVEARVAFPAVEEVDEIPTPTRRFSVMEITSGLLDDCREADERELARGLRDLRGRVKAARVVISSTPGLEETLTRDWHKAAMFYARLGITQGQLRAGVAAGISVLPAIEED